MVTRLIKILKYWNEEVEVHSSWTKKKIKIYMTKRWKPYLFVWGIVFIGFIFSFLLSLYQGKFFK